jgi:ribosomal peptide maturation radical SAM protein 1
MKYFNDFVPELAAREWGLELFYEVKANLRKEHIFLLSDAGITSIQPGIESFSTPVLQLMKKGVTGLQNIQLLKWCKEIGVEPGWNMLWGFPGEPPPEYARMADLIPLISHLQPPASAVKIRLDRFSPNFDHAAEYGFSEVEPYPAYSYIYLFEPSSVANLAYFFTFQYRDGRNVLSYTEPVKKAVAEWQSTYEVSDLFSVDKESHLLIWDLRPIARVPLTALTGLQRTLYLECDSICSIRRLQEVAAADTLQYVSAAAVEEILQPLLGRGLMIREGRSYLALAVPLGRYSPRRAVLEQLQETIQKLGTSSGRETVIPLGEPAPSRSIVAV